MARSQNMNALRFGWGFAAAAAMAVSTGLLFTGCAALSTRDLARVVAAAPPVASTSASLATLPEDDPRRPLILSEAGRFADPHSVKFFAAREAFWDYDTDTAVRLLRELRQAEAMSEAHFHTLVLQCYEQSGRWTDAVSAYREFKLEESHPGPLNHARFRASLPRRAIVFAAQPEDVPIRVRNGGWVSAEGTINGTKGRFGLDTGAGLSWVSERFARRAGIEITSQTISLRDANNSERIVPIGLIRELRLAGLTVRHAPVIVDRSLVMDVLGGEDAKRSCRRRRSLDAVAARGARARRDRTQRRWDCLGSGSAGRSNPVVHPAGPRKEHVGPTSAAARQRPFCRGRHGLGDARQRPSQCDTR